MGRQLLVSRCRSCDAPIVWAVTEHGKRMPVDLAPYRNGPEDRLIADVRRMLLEHRQTLVELRVLEPLENAVAEYDATFDPRGLFVLRSPTDGTTSPTATAVTPDSFPSEPLYRSHFTTCPDRDDWRRS